VRRHNKEQMGDHGGSRVVPAGSDYKRQPRVAKIEPQKHKSRSVPGTNIKSAVHCKPMNKLVCIQGGRTFLKGDKTAHTGGDKKPKRGASHATRWGTFLGTSFARPGCTGARSVTGAGTSATCAMQRPGGVRSRGLPPRKRGRKGRQQVCGKGWQNQYRRKKDAVLLVGH